MTTESFLRMLCSKSGIPFDGIYEKGRKEGWLEAEDEVFKDQEITRKNVARISHMYLLKVSGLSDLDMSGAKGLKDLYDCRVCANHIAQVYMRGIMDAKDLKRDGGFLWFDLEGTDTEETNEAIIGRLVQISNS